MCDICKDRMKLKEYLTTTKIPERKFWEDDTIREQFESEIALSMRAKNSKDKYLNSQIEHQWKGFQLGWKKSIITK